MKRIVSLLFVFVTLGLTAAPVLAQSAAQAPGEDPDLQTNLAQPDFTLVSLPTTLRLPKFKGAFRVTHRFGRALGEGSFASLAEDLFGLDGGAQIGIEYRFGLLSGTQVGVHRTSDRTVQFFVQHEVLAQGGSKPFDVHALAAIDGTNTMRDSYSPSLGAVVSREFADRAAIYVTPLWVSNTNPLPSAVVDDNDTVAIGLAARLRIRPRVYLVLEATPRVSGYQPGDDHVAVGIERRAGGHSFQLTFSNGFGTTLPQIVRGGTDDWFLGFGISRKFF